MMPTTTRSTRRRFALLAAGVLLLAVVAPGGSGAVVRGQAAATPVAADAGPAATVAALETRVAELEAQVAVLQVAVAALAEDDAAAPAPPSPTPAAPPVAPPAPTQPAAPTAGPVASAAVGETVAVVDAIGDRYDLTVRQVERDRAFETVYRIEAVGVFVLIDFEFTNRGLDEAFLVPAEWTIADGQGRTYTPSFDGQIAWDVYVGQDLEGALQPDVAYDLRIVFDIAPTATDLTLLIEGTDVAIDLGV